MNDGAIELIVEDIELAIWIREFQSRISSMPVNYGITVSWPQIGVLGPARKKESAKISRSIDKESFDTTVKLLGLLLSALSLTIASVQLVKSNAVKDSTTVRCTIDGVTGSKDLLVTGSGKIDETILRACLSETGIPKRITARKVK